MSLERPVRPPGGMAPPERAVLPDGSELDLRQLAAEISTEHLSRHPEELQRYGEAVRAWCEHDNRHLLNWAALEVDGLLDFGAQVSWLANVLHSRGYPLANLADDLTVAAAVVRRRVSGGHAVQMAEVLERGIDSIEPVP